MEQDEDEERIAERAIEANGGVLRKVFPVWSRAARDRIAERGSLSPDVLLVAAGDFACDLVHDGVAAGGISLNPLGALAVAGVTAKGLTLEPSADDDACVVHDLGGGVVVVAARHRIPVESAREWASSLVNAVKPGAVVVLYAMDRRRRYGVDGTGARSSTPPRMIETSLACSAADVPLRGRCPWPFPEASATIAARCGCSGSPPGRRGPGPDRLRDGRRFGSAEDGARRMGVGQGLREEVDGAPRRTPFD